MNALSSATWSVMLALGAALGGLVAGTWGIYPAFVLDTLTFLLSAALLMQIRMPARLATAAADKTVAASVRQYIDGLRYLREHPDILFISLQKAINSLCLTAGFQVVMVAVSQQVFIIGEGGGIGMGLFFGLAGVGTGIGPILARKIDRGPRPDAEKSDCCWLSHQRARVRSDRAPLQPAYSVAGDDRARNRRWHNLGLLHPVTAAKRVPGRVHGRVFASEFMFFYLGSALASSVVGAALDSNLSISAIIWWMTGLTVIPMALWILSVMRGKREVV